MYSFTYLCDLRLSKSRGKTLNNVVIVPINEIALKYGVKESEGLNK